MRPGSLLRHVMNVLRSDVAVYFILGALCPDVVGDGVFQLLMTWLGSSPGSRRVIRPAVSVLMENRQSRCDRFLSGQAVARRDPAANLENGPGYSRASPIRSVTVARNVWS